MNRAWIGRERTREVLEGLRIGAVDLTELVWAGARGQAGWLFTDTGDGQVGKFGWVSASGIVSMPRYDTTWAAHNGLGEFLEAEARNSYTPHPVSGCSFCAYAMALFQLHGDSWRDKVTPGVAWGEHRMRQPSGLPTVGDVVRVNRAIRMAANQAIESGQ